MIIRDSIKIALAAIRANLVRSILTMLGLIIGVAAVVSLMGVGLGVKKDVSKMIFDLGSNLLIAVPGKVDPGEGFRPESIIGGNILTKKDVKIVKEIEDVSQVAPISILSGLIKYTPDNGSNQEVTAKNVLLSATTFEMEGVTNFELEKGRFFNKNDENKNAKVAVLGNKSKVQLFGSADAVGKTILINNQEFEIIGSLKKLGTTDVFGGGNFFDEIVTIPITTAEDITGAESPIHRMIIKVKEELDVNNVAETVRQQILQSHSGSDDFTVLTQEDLLGLMDDILNILTTLVTAIAAISLVVGGIGIMNIMLVSVTERTREIGLRKAVGATTWSILLQFLIEATTISILGGLIGVLFAFIGTEIVAARTVLTPEISFNAILLAFGVSVGVGIIFGLAPAIRAARKDPIDALRYE